MLTQHITMHKQHITMLKQDIAIKLKKEYKLLNEVQQYCMYLLKVCKYTQ